MALRRVVVMAALAVPTLCCGVACRESSESVSIPTPRGADGKEQPSPGAVDGADRFAGKPVPDFSAAVSMILTRRENFPKVGELAPSFHLTNAISGKPVALAELHQDRPVVLIFGSGSCSVLCRTDAWMAEFYRRYGDQLNFCFIYIREAHPQEGYRPRRDAGEVHPLRDAETHAERKLAAADFARLKQLPFPILIDDMNDETARQYSAWPVRLFVVDPAGKVLYCGGQAPWFYRPFDGYQHDPPAEDELRALPQSEQSLQGFLRRNFGS